MGASARSAAFSALRLGLRPRCADYFADRDLAAVCPVDRVEPATATNDFLRLAESLPPSPWYFTGGFENRPGLVERISRRHRLWGIDAATLRAVRDPVQVARVLGQAGIPCPAVGLDPQGLPRDGSWLVKPVASSGGRGIEPLTDGTGSGSSARYYQERIEGSSFSALFLGHGSRSLLVGITRQFIGKAGSPFAYCGSLGPCAIPLALAQQLRVIGDRLAAAFELRGWFGVDYVLRAGIPWPVEVNPRYPASLEIHELALGRSLLDDHRRCCEGTMNLSVGTFDPCSRRSPTIAKEILHAPRRLVAPDFTLDQDAAVGLHSVPAIADVPWPGTRFDAGEPVMTLFAKGEDATSCCSRLTRLKREWMERLTDQNETGQG
jgi:predicted ATP-grasp superfamily ATP-dependent carboligase